MVKKLVSRAEFARMAGVSGAAVTKACGSALAPAVVGKRIDADHPAAKNYMGTQAFGKTPPPAQGIDILYEAALEYCSSAGTYSAYSIQKEFRIGSDRATRIIGTMRANKLIPYGKDTLAPEGKRGPQNVAAPNVVARPTVSTPPPAVETVAAPPEPPRATVSKKPHVRGPAAAKEKKKREAADNEEALLEIPADIQAFGKMTLFELIERFGTDCRFVDWLSATQKIEAINEKRLKNAATEGELVSRKLVRTGIIEPIDACHIKLLTDGSKTIARRSTAMHAAGRQLKDIEAFVAEQITSFIRPVKAKVARALKNA